MNDQDSLCGEGNETQYPPPKPNIYVPFESSILHWALQRNIIGPTAVGTREAQVKKTLEECRELAHGITTDNVDEVRDAIGDIIVTLAIQANMWNLSLGECIESAYEQIKNRTGRMQNGTFVKD